jgi:catechol 2,3-dioxygenase-like lactoylglutathione lyase family enzyme
MNRKRRRAALALTALARLSTAQAQDPASGVHFHHVHLNVTDPKATIAFYQKFFGANEVKYRGLSDALFTEKSFILLTRVSTPPPTNLGTSLWHIGWAGVDGGSEFAWRTREGIGVQTPLTPLGGNHYMYFWGPDREVIEVYTGSKNHRFEHFHLLASNLSKTLGWFQEHLGLTPRMPADSKLAGVPINLLRIDNVNLYIMERPASGQPRPAWLPAEVGDSFPVTEGTAIDHVAFSLVDVTPVLRRMRRAGLAIVRPLARSREYGLTSFFVRGPDGLLVEIVQEAPVPEGVWAIP